MVSINTVRTLTVRYQTEGAEKMRSDADAVAGAQQRAGQAAAQAADAISRASERSAKVTDTAVKGQLSALKAVEREALRVDAQFRGERAFERATTTFGRGLTQGVLDQAEFDRRVQQARDRYLGGNDNDPTKPRRGLDANQRRDLMYQGGDVVASLGSGAGLGTVAFQQGPQILQGLAAGEGGLRGGLKALGESALALVTPMTVAGTAVAALGTAMVVAARQAAADQEVLEKATMGIGRATGATVGQLDALARANAEAGKVSTSTAREIVAGYAQGGQIALPVIGDLTRATAEYARVTGQDVPAATAELAGMFADPARGADELAAKIGGLDDRTRQLIQTQIEQGDRSAAQQTQADYLKGAIDANAQATTGWAAAWNTATSAANGYWEAAKRIAGIKLGVAPEGAQATVDRLNKEIENANQILKFTGREPLGLGSEKVRQRDAAMIVADTERRKAEADAAHARADQASRAAGQIARAVDPNFDRLSILRKQQSDLRDALADPLARNGLSDFGQTESAYLSVTRAIGSLTDANGKLISSEEMARRQDQLRLDSIKAKTEAEKAAVAERQKAFDLIGKTIEPGDARGQIARAGQIALASESAKGAGKSDADSRDEYDRAVRSLEDRMRRQAQEAQTYGLGAEAAARYRAETDLLTAAKRAERDITPALTAEIQSYADRAATAAGQQEKLRESMRDMDELRGAGRDAFGGMFRDLSRGVGAADAFANALGRIQDRIAGMAADSLTDALFGKRGSSETGLLSSLLGGGSSGGSSVGMGDILGFLTGSVSPIPKFANGSLLGGPGGPRSDNLLVRASPGEYIVNAHATAQYRGMLDAINGGRLPAFADGGYVDWTSAAAPLPDDRRNPVTAPPPGNSNAAPSSPGPVEMTVKVEGANGDAQIRSMVAQGVAEGIGQYDSQIVHRVGPRLAKWQARYVP